jgi:hypothetical protein
MKKFRLEDLEKRQVFNKPPEGYFDRLPGIIQAKTAHQAGKGGRQIVWSRALKLVPVAALLVLIALYSGIFQGDDTEPGFEAFLTEVSSEDIIWYLEELDISNEEILEEVDLKALSLELDHMDDPLMNSLEIEDEALIQLYDDFDLQDSLL